jgi:hypothetical protein
VQSGGGLLVMGQGERAAGFDLLDVGSCQPAEALLLLGRNMAQQIPAAGALTDAHEGESIAILIVGPARVQPV